MRDSCEMRREAWGILKGKWLWRLLCVVILLQFVSSAVNTALVKTYDALSITTLGDYLMATANAMRLGIFALMTPVITSTDGRWVATIR